MRQSRTQSRDDFYFDDPVNEPKDRNRFAPLILLFSIALFALGLRTVFAANIGINSGETLEFGQGIVTTVACSGNNNLTITPRTSFDNDAASPVFKLAGITVAGVPSECSRKKLAFSAYDDSSSSPLVIFGGSSTALDVTYTGTSFVSSSEGVSLSDLSSSGFTATFSVPIAISTDVARFSVQTSNDNDFENLGSLTFGASDLVSVSSVDAVGTGAFTVEVFVKITSAAGGDGLIFHGNDGIGLYMNSDRDQIKITKWGPGSGTQVFYVNALSLNTWHHIAVVRDGSSRTQLFLNGSKSANSFVTDNNSYASSSYVIFGTGTGHKLVGNMSNLRFTNTAVYDPTATTITRPSTPLRNVTGTILLLNTKTSNPFADSSSSPKTVTPSGNPTSSADSPFN